MAKRAKKGTSVPKEKKSLVTKQKTLATSDKVVQRNRKNK